MSEKLFKFLLSELTTVRIFCPACKGTVELPIDRIVRQTHECQLCKVEFGTEVVAEGFKELSSALRKLGMGKAEIQFVLPDKE